MENLFDARTLASLPWSPIALWQANLQMMSNLQQTWLNLLMPGKAGKEGGTGRPGFPGLNGQWVTPEPFLAALMPFMPKIEATITPLKPEGRLAGAEDASRVTMRMTVPGLGGQNATEVLLVDAVVARAAGGEDTLRLKNSDLPAVLSKKD